MQPILAADSFRLNSGDFQVQSGCTVSSNAAQSADDLVVLPNYIDSLFQAAESKPGAIIGSVETTSENPTRIKNGKR